MQNNEKNHILKKQIIQIYLNKWRCSLCDFKYRFFFRNKFIIICPPLCYTTFFRNIF